MQPPIRQPSTLQPFSPNQPHRHPISVPLNNRVQVQSQRVQPVRPHPQFVPLKVLNQPPIRMGHLMPMTGTPMQFGGAV